MIEFIALHKSFENKKVLNGIDLVIRRGESTYIIGSSGSGKSVLMKHAVGLLTPDSGRVLIDGEDCTNADEDRWMRIRRKVCLVSQQPALFDSMNLMENVALPLRKIKRLKPKDAFEEAIEFLRMVGMDEKAHLMPSQVGPSEAKRVSIARALTLSPECTILDEPTTGLDIPTAHEIDTLVERLGKEMGKTVIVISHDIRSMFRVADSIVFLYKGQVWAQGPKEMFRDPSDPIVRQFIKGDPEGPMET